MPEFEATTTTVPHDPVGSFMMDKFFDTVETQMDLNPKKPRPGTKMAQVLSFVKEGLSDREIGDLLGRNADYVTKARLRLIHGGFMEATDSKIKQTNRARRVSIARGGTWILAEPFIRIQMSNVEISEAIEQTSVIKLTPDKIKRSASHAALKGVFAREWHGNSLEEQLIANESKLPKEVIAERVHFWLEAKSILEQDPEIPLPQTRKDWLLLSRYSAICHKLSESMNDEEEASQEIAQAAFLQILDQETQMRLQTSFEAIHNHYVPFTRNELAQIFTNETDRNTIFKTIYNKVGDRDLAEDLAAETFYIVWNKKSKYKRIKGKPLLAWIVTIARNKAIDHLRKQKHHPQTTLIEEIYGEDSFEEESINNTFLKGLLAKLPEEQKHVILLKFGQGLTLEEIANVLNKSRGYIKNIVGKAMHALKQTAVNNN